MGAHLNPLEKEVLIKRYLSRENADLHVFCMANNISEGAFKTWLKKYIEEGIEGLITRRKGEENLMVLPEGVTPSEENMKREIMKLRIENERLKKKYTVMKTPAGETVFRHLKERSSK